MNRRIIPALAALALAIAPALVSAEPDRNTTNGQTQGCWQNGQWTQNCGQYQNRQNGRYQNGDRRHRRDEDRDDNDGDRGNRGNHYGWNKGRGNPHGGYNNGYGNNGYGGYGYGNGNGLSGRVSSFSPYNMYLQNGLHVELHDGTIINPNGATPQPGQRVQIQGHWNADRTFAADVITLS